MKKAPMVLAFAAATTLAACGGGGSSPTPTSGTPPPPPPPPPSSLSVTLSETAQTVQIAEGESASFGFTASYTGASSDPIVADVQVGGRRYLLDGAPTSSGSQFDVKLKTADFPAGGLTTSEVTFRLCTSSACSTVYPGSTQTFAVTLDVDLGDWETFQRNPAHTAYVAASYDTSDFALAWSAPADLNSAGAITVSAPSAKEGLVYANFRQSNGRLITRALSAGSGTRTWGVDLGSHGYFSAPSVTNDRVVTVSMDISSGNLPVQILDSAGGGIEGTIFYSSQFANSGAATLIDDQIFLQAGYFGNVVFGYDAATATRIWQNKPVPPSSGFVQEGQSVAADENFVYFYGISSLFIHSRSTGEVVKQIADPFFSRGGTSYFGTYFGGPILDGAGGIYTFSDNHGPRQPNPIAAFDFDAENMRWRTAESYVGAAALRDGKLYAPRGNSTIVDVIDTADGSVIASIDVGSDKADLLSNVIVTESHLFVGNTNETFAIDLTASGNPVVFTADKGGFLALSPDNLLLISHGTGIDAYRLF